MPRAARVASVISMELDGIPLHPLVNDAAVSLVPLAAVMGIVVAALPGWRWLTRWVLLLTTVGGLGHALPYLIADFWIATGVAAVVVLIELWAIAFIQNRWMQTPFWRAALQVVVGGSLVFAAGILIGSA